VTEVEGSPRPAEHLVADYSRKPSVNRFDGIIDGAGLQRQDPRLLFRRVMFAMARKQAGQAQRRRDTREHVVLYVKALNAWATDEPITRAAVHPTREHAPHRQDPLNPVTGLRRPDPALGRAGFALPEPAL
jgi:hypothetical protein